MCKLTQLVSWSMLGLGLLVAAGCSEQQAPPSTKVITPPRTATEPPATTPAQAEPVAAATEKPAQAQPAPEAAAAQPATTPAETPEPAQTEVAAKPAEEPKRATEVKPEAPAAAAAQGTTIRGRVVVKGELATVAPIVPTKDEVCIAVGEIPNDRVVVGDDGGLADVFVWVKRHPKDAKIPEAPSEEVVLDQKGCQFHPKAMSFQIGQKFLVMNDDPTLHNTHTVPFVNSPGFNQGIQPNDRTGQEIPYRRSEIIPVTTTCDIHPWMKSFHLPLEHPWSAVTDEHGAFEISNLPTGDVEFAIWHESGWVQKSLKLTLTDGQVVEQNFEVAAADLAE